MYPTASRPAEEAARSNTFRRLLPPDADASLRPWRARADHLHTIWPFDNHEVVPVLTAPIGRPSDFFNEGIAVSFQTDPARAAISRSPSMASKYTKPAVSTSRQRRCERMLPQEQNGTMSQKQRLSHRGGACCLPRSSACTCLPSLQNLDGKPIMTGDVRPQIGRQRMIADPSEVTRVQQLVF